MPLERRIAFSEENGEFIYEKNVLEGVAEHFRLLIDPGFSQQIGRELNGADNLPFTVTFYRHPYNNTSYFQLEGAQRQVQVLCAGKEYRVPDDLFRIRTSVKNHDGSLALESDTMTHLGMEEEMQAVAAAKYCLFEQKKYWMSSEDILTVGFTPENDRYFAHIQEGTAFDTLEQYVYPSAEMITAWEEAGFTLSAEDLNPDELAQLNKYREVGSTLDMIMFNLESMCKFGLNDIDFTPREWIVFMAETLIENSRIQSYDTAIDAVRKGLKHYIIRDARRRELLIEQEERRKWWLEQQALEDQRKEAQMKDLAEKRAALERRFEEAGIYGHDFHGDKIIMGVRREEMITKEQAIELSIRAHSELAHNPALLKTAVDYIIYFMHEGLSFERIHVILEGVIDFSLAPDPLKSA